MFRLYATGGYSPYTSIKAGYDATLDTISCAGTLDQPQQELLAQRFAFARSAYNWLWNPAMLPSMLINGTITAPPEPAAETSHKWGTHLGFLHN